jgi:hypothetical protein
MKHLIILLYPVFVITSIVTHIWTVIIAFSESGFLGGIITLILPGISEIYWMFKMFGENDLYAYIALIQLILAIPMTALKSDR